MERQIPGLLWVSLILLGVISLIQLMIGLERGLGGVLVGIAVNLVLLTGLALGYRWAYVLLLVGATLGFLASFGRGLAVAIGVLFGNALVVVPVLLCTDFFFKRQENEEQV